MTNPILSFQGINTFYGPMQVHFDLSFSVEEGKILALLGSNASGKSTVMKICMGLHSIKSGSIIFRDQNISNLAIHKRIAMGLAAVPEARRLFHQMTVKENLQMGAYLRKNRRDIDHDLESMYQLFPRLAERRNQIAGTMSGGEQQIIAIARCLMSKPRLIIFDEPTMGLSPQWLSKILELIQKLNQSQGLSVLLIEQNVHAALAIAHQSCVLQNGQLILSGPAQEIATNPAIKSAFLAASE